MKLKYKKTESQLLLLVRFAQDTRRLLPEPETRQHPPFKGALHLLQQPDLPLSLLYFLHCIKTDDTCRLVQVNPDPGALGNVPDFFGAATGPHLVVRPTPPKTPGLIVFSQPAGSVAGPPPCSLIGDSDNHPS